MSDDLLIINSLDQDVVTDNEDVLLKIEQLIQESIDTKDVYKALNICKQVYNVALLSGKALAKILYLLQSNWSTFSIADDFCDTLTAYTGMSRRTILTYPSVYSMEAENKIPELYRDEIMAKNIKNLVPIAKTLEAGYELDGEDWEDLVQATDFSTISAKLRDIKGKEPRPQALIITLERDGTLQVVQNDTICNCGWLDIESDDPITQKAINRIVTSSGIMTR